VRGDRIVKSCSCLSAVTDMPCVCFPVAPYDGWLERVFERNAEMLKRLPRALQPRDHHTHPKEG
jgi:hypothetical protein